MGDGALPRAQLASSAVPTGAQKGSCPCSLDHLDPKVKVVGCALLVLTTIYDNARDHHPCSVCGTYRRVMDTWLWPSKPPHLQVMLMWKGTRNRSVYIRKKAYGLYWHLSLCKLCTEILYLPQSHFFFVYLFLLEKRIRSPTSEELPPTGHYERAKTQHSACDWPGMDGVYWCTREAAQKELAPAVAV
jgi:hypothetical protein